MDSVWRQRGGRGISIKKFRIMEHDETTRRNKWTAAFRRRMSSRFSGTSNEFPPPGREGGRKEGWLKSHFHAAMVIASQGRVALSLSLAGFVEFPMDLSRFFHCVTGPRALYDWRQSSEEERGPPGRHHSRTSGIFSILGLLGKGVRPLRTFEEAYLLESSRDFRNFRSYSWVRRSVTSPTCTTLSAKPMEKACSLSVRFAC